MIPETHDLLMALDLTMTSKNLVGMNLDAHLDVTQNADGDM